MTYGPYIPAWMDDAGLTPIQFRILAHLHRRAGKKMRCWPGAESIRAACKVSDDAMWPAIKVLEERGFIRREKRRYNSNEYFLILPDVTPENRVTVSPTETGELLPHLSGEPSPTETGELLPGNCGRKGTEREVTTRSDTMKGEAPALVPFPWKSVSELPAELKSRLASAYPDPTDQADVLMTIRGRELSFKGRHAVEDWPAVLIAGIDREDRGDSKLRKESGRGAFADDSGRRRPTKSRPTSTRTQEETAHGYSW